MGINNPRLLQEQARLSTIAAALVAELHERDDLTYYQDTAAGCDQWISEKLQLYVTANIATLRFSTFGYSVEWDSTGAMDTENRQCDSESLGRMIDVLASALQRVA